MKNQTTRTLWALFIALSVVFAACTDPLPAQQAVSPPQYTSFSGSLSATGTTIALPLYTGGFNTCSVVVSGNSSGVVATAQVASDHQENSASATYVTASNVGTSGVVSTNGTYVGNVAASGLTWFRVNLTAIASGTWAYTEACSTANTGGGGGGAGGNVTVTNTPGVIVINTPGVGCVSGCAAPFPGNVDGQAVTASGQSIGTSLYNGTTYDRMRSNGTLGQLAAAPFQVTTLTCFGTVGSNNLACNNAAGTAVCVNNAATDTCTIATAVGFYGMLDNNTGPLAIGFECHDATTSANISVNNPLLVTTASSTLQPATPVIVPAAASKVTTGKITCKITGTGSLGASGTSLWYQ